MNLAIPFIPQAAQALRKLFTSSQAAPLPSCGQAPPAAPPPSPLPPPPGPWLRCKRLLRSVFGRQRGARAWVMLVGARGSGKSSLATSAAAGCAGHASQPPRLPGAQCVNLLQGMLLDADGALQPAQWNQLLDQLELLRPQRPLDGLLLTVSAATLALAANTALLADAQAAQQQMLRIQLRYQWVLPVYVVVTGCDRLASGAVFRVAMAPIPPGEMVGWSAPEVGDYAGAQRWSDSAFDQLAERFRLCQLRQAALAQPVTLPYQLADGAFLLPHSLQALRAPLASWLDAALRPGTTQQGWMMRGIYFTGAGGEAPAAPALRADVQFLADLVSHKVLAERHLAEPTRSGRRARRFLQRLLLWGSCLFIAALTLGLVAETVALNNDLAQLEQSLRAIDHAAAQPPDSACLEQERVAGLVQGMRSAPVPSYLPWSLVDRRARDRSAAVIARTALESAVLPALLCKLNQRSDQLVRPGTRTPDSQLGPDSQLRTAREDLLSYMDQVLALEQDYARLRQLDARSAAADPAAATRALYDLLASQYQQGPWASTKAATRYTWPDWLQRAGAAVGVRLSPIVLQPAARVADQDALVLRAVSLLRQPQSGQPPRNQLQAEIRRRQARLPGYLQLQLKHGAEQLEALDRNAAGLRAPELLQGARDAYAWLNWVQNSLLTSTAAANPCRDSASDSGTRQAALAYFGYQLPAPDAQPQTPQQCYTALMEQLATLSLPGYGPVVSAASGSKPRQLNPLLVPEVDGLGALLAQDFMQIAGTQDFQCLRQGALWQPETIQHARDAAREYQLLARKQGVSSGGHAPLFDRIARRQLELVMNDTLAAAQSPAIFTLGQAGLGGAGPDARLSRMSADFGAAAAPLAGVVQLYQQMDMAGAATILSACVRDQASDGLTRVGELAESSRLYLPQPELAGAAGVQEYLDSQIARTQVLTGYAAPYVQVLQNTPAVDDARKWPSQTGPYWSNTIVQLSQYLAHDNNGQAGQLHSLIKTLLSGADPSPCPAPKMPDASGTDLFSARRLRLQSLQASACDSQAQAQLAKDYGALSDAFNSQLFGHYPFAGLASDDAPPALVKQFYTDYGTLLSSVRSRYARLDTKAMAAAAARRIAMQADFLNRLDDMGKALMPRLSNGTPLRIAVAFYARPQDSRGSEQVVVWTMSSGAVTVGAPNRQSGKLDWPLGQALSFDLEWADRSTWRPLADRTQRDLQVSGTSAQFGYSGDWALLRMLEQHRLPDNDDAILLQFLVPLAPLGAPASARASDQARIYLTLGLSGTDGASVKLPMSFPHFAPR